MFLALSGTRTLNPPKINCMSKLLTILLFIMPQALFAQIAQEKVIDLSVKVNTTTTVQAGKDLKIKLTNRSLTAPYEIIIERKQELLPIMDWPNTELAETKFQNDDSCAEFLENVNQLLMSVDEAEIKHGRSKIITDVKCYPPNKHKIQPLLAAFDTVIIIEDVKQNEKITITVKRPDDPSKTWSLIAKSNPAGFWKTTYGFALASQAFAQSEEFYLNGNNVITRSNDKGKIDYMPAVFFTYIPFKHLDQWASPGLTAGLGVDFNVNPVLFLAFSLTHKENLGIQVGLSAYQLQYLKGRYKENDVIGEANFDENNLHRKLFRINPFVALSFNITNPNRSND